MHCARRNARRRAVCRCNNEAKLEAFLLGCATRMNLPNSITMSRIVMIPLLLWILTQHFP